METQRELLKTRLHDTLTQFREAHGLPEMPSGLETAIVTNTEESNDALLNKTAACIASGVKAFWLIDLRRKSTFAFDFSTEPNTFNLYPFDKPIPVHIYKDAPEPLLITIADLLK